MGKGMGSISMQGFYHCFLLLVLVDKVVEKGLIFRLHPFTLVQ